MSDQNVLLAGMGCGAAESHVTQLAGLGTPTIQERGSGEHILLQDTEPCHTAFVQLSVRPTSF